MKSPTENIIKTLKGKRVLFLENDNVLENGLDSFEDILKEGGIEYKVFFEVDTMKLEDIVKAIGEYDAIVFMTQWVYDISKKLSEYMFALKDKKIVIEVFISDPTWYYKPKGIPHDVYIYSCLRDRFSDEKEKFMEKFYKLSNKPYWDYKNKFDK